MKTSLEIAWENLLAAREEAYVAWYKSGGVGGTPRYREALRALMQARDGFDRLKNLAKTSGAGLTLLDIDKEV